MADQRSFRPPDADPTPPSESPALPDLDANAILSKAWIPGMGHMALNRKSRDSIYWAISSSSPLSSVGGGTWSSGGSAPRP